MELYPFFKSLLDQDTSAVVICDRNHKIIYINPAACLRYEKYGGIALLGKNLLACHNERSAAMIEKVLTWFDSSRENNSVHTFYNEKENKDVYMIALRDEDGKLIGYYEKHDYRNRDTAPLYQLT